MNHQMNPTPAEGRRGRGSCWGTGCLNRAGVFALGSVQSFHFPLFMTMLHLAVIFLFSALSRALVQCSSHRARVVLSWADYLRRVAPTGRWGTSVRAGQEEGLGNHRMRTRETPVCLEAESVPSPALFLLCPLDLASLHPRCCLLHTACLPTAPPHTHKTPAAPTAPQLPHLAADTEPGVWPRAWR